MTSPLDVFDFNEEDDESEFIGAKYSNKVKTSGAPDKYRFLKYVTQGENMQFKEFNTILHVDVDTNSRHHNIDCTASVASSDCKDFGVKSVLDGLPHKNSCFVEKYSQSKQSKVESKHSRSQMGGSSRYEVASLDGDIKFKCPHLESSSSVLEVLNLTCSVFRIKKLVKSSHKLELVQDESSDADPSADESFSENSQSTSSYIDDNDVHLDGPSSGQFFGSWQMVDGEFGVECFPDYIVYRDKYLTNCVITFSSHGIKVKDSTVCGENATYIFQWGVDDIFDIESQWYRKIELATVKIQVISRGSVSVGDLRGTSGIEVLKFAVVGDWCEKQEAILSMDVYKPLCRRVLNSDMKTDVENFPEHNNGVLSSSHYFPPFDKPFEDLVYPKGEPDAVSISKRDIDLLQPDTFVNDTIIDFYIKYLKNKIEPDERHRFHFFNSFFFRKLADLDKNPSSALEGRAAFQRVRKWTRKINLFEKDYLFIPVNFNYHWSLIVVCYPGEVAECRDADVQQCPKVPCILHMDSIRGIHSGLKCLLQSYLWEEWKERHSDSSEDISSRFRNLRFLSLELPQQQNSYDCGLFLLHYVELFLDGVPANFNPFKLTKYSDFLTADWFQPSEASLKRTSIQRMIYDLLDGGSIEVPQGSGSAKKVNSSCATSFHENETSVEFLADRYHPSKVFHGNAMSSQSGQEQELTFLPSSSLKRSPCASNSGFVLGDLSELGDAEESFYQALKQSAPFKNAMASMEESALFKNTMPSTEEFLEQGEKETVKHCGSPATAETGLGRLVTITSEASIPYLSTEIRRDPLLNPYSIFHQKVPEDIESLPETSPASVKPLGVEVVIDSLEATNVTADGNTDQSRVPSSDNQVCLLDCLDSACGDTLDQVCNPDQQSDYNNAYFVPHYPTKLHGSSFQAFDTGENRTGSCEGVQSVSDDNVSVTYEIRGAKRRRLCTF